MFKKLISIVMVTIFALNLGVTAFASEKTTINSKQMEKLIINKVKVTDEGLIYDANELKKLGLSKEKYEYLIKNLEYINENINSSQNLLRSKSSSEEPCNPSDPNAKFRNAGGEEPKEGFIYMQGRYLRRYFDYDETKKMLENFRNNDPIFMGINLIGLKSFLVAILAIFITDDEKEMSRAFLDSDENGVYMQWKYNATGTRSYGPWSEGDTIPSYWSIIYK